VACSFVFAQAQPPKPAFEVVSIKHASSAPLPALMASGKWRFLIDDAQIDFGSISLSELIQLAYQLPDDQILGPRWLAEERFDIAAKLPAGASKNQVPEMLQAMPWPWSRLPML
jgi:uncharacterized protein (TIGR03435 family)